jgi:hypothetical protein
MNLADERDSAVEVTHPKRIGFKKEKSINQ